MNQLENQMLSPNTYSISPGTRPQYLPLTSNPEYRPKGFLNFGQACDFQ